MSIRSLKRLKRRLIPVIAIAAAIVPTSAQAQVTLDGGSSSGSGVVIPGTHIWNSYDVGGTLVPASGTFQSVGATRPDDRGTRGSFVDQIQQPAPVAVSAPSGGFSWGSASFGVLAGFLAAMALAAAALGLRRQKQHAGLVY